MSDDEKKVAGHRKAIQDHIAKYERYTAQQDKDFAFKTIQRVQKEIQDLKRRNPRLRNSPEDSWTPR